MGSGIIMESGMILQIAMVIAGVVLLCITVSSLAKNRMTAPFSLTWSIIAVMFIIAGIMLRPAGWKRYISPLGLLLVLLVGVCVLYGTLFVSVQVSKLMRKVNEMAILISLLTQEKEQLESRIERLEELVEQGDLTAQDDRKRDEIS